MAKILYDANYDKELVAKRNQCHDLCHQYNQLLPTAVEERKKVLQAIIGEMEDDLIIEQPFYCDYGTNIRLGKQEMCIRDRASSILRRFSFLFIRTLFRI